VTAGAPPFPPRIPRSSDDADRFILFFFCLWSQDSFLFFLLFWFFFLPRVVDAPSSRVIRKFFFFVSQCLLSSSRPEAFRSSSFARGETIGSSPFVYLWCPPLFWVYHTLPRTHKEKFLSGPTPVFRFLSVPMRSLLGVGTLSLRWCGRVATN